jgi:hypothetical protein
MWQQRPDPYHGWYKLDNRKALSFDILTRLEHVYFLQQIHTHASVLIRTSLALFDAATLVQLGDGECAKFWRDRWLDGAKVEDIAPNLAALVLVRVTKTRTVKEGLSGLWLRDCGPDLGAAALGEFFTLWQILAMVHLSPGREDTLRWCWSSDGAYSSKSAYRAFFDGQTWFPTATMIWRSRAPYGCKFFA